jgi:hypothetical protein
MECGNVTLLLAPFVSIHDGAVMRRSKLHQFPNHYKMTRYYYNHTSSPDFHRIITIVYGESVTSCFV